jgi:hypothetical protein
MSEILSIELGNSPTEEICSLCANTALTLQSKDNSQTLFIQVKKIIFSCFW